jgi:protein CpxP
MFHVRTLVMGLGVAVCASTAALAQGEGDSTSQTPSPAVTRGVDSAPHRHMGRRHGPGGHALFRGITMTDAQRSQLKEIHAKYRPEAQSIRESMRPAFQEARAARQRGDTAAARAAWSRTSDARAKLRALHDQQLADVRAILTPEQRQQFDQNRAALQSKMRQFHQRRAGSDSASS